MNIGPSLYPCGFGSVLFTHPTTARSSAEMKKRPSPPTWPFVYGVEHNYFDPLFAAWSFAWVEYLLTAARKASLP